GPHHRDVPLRDILPILLRARPAGLSVEAPNPRHAHERSGFEEGRLPADKGVLPGGLDTTTKFLQHPEPGPHRSPQSPRRVGRANVLGSDDCGFATFADTPTVDPKIAWAKLGAMVEGARLASRALEKPSRRVTRSAAAGAHARAGRRPSPPSRASRGPARRRGPARPRPHWRWPPAATSPRPPPPPLPP